MHRNNNIICPAVLPHDTVRPNAFCRERRRRTTTASARRQWVSFLVLICCLLPRRHHHVSAFGMMKPPTTTRTTSSVLLFVSKTTDTWSRNGGESSFGARKRVQKVLAKARSFKRRKDASIVAEAASMGLETADFVNRQNDNNNGKSETPVTAFQNATDVQLVLEPPVSTTTTTTTTTTSAAPPVEVDSVLNTGATQPLPFVLPQLSEQQKELLVQGERVQEQSKMGREGSGYVVLDVKAPDYVVWEALLDFEKYPEYIGTVRSMTMFTNTHLKQSYVAEKPVLPGTGKETRRYGSASITRASFVLSKFKLKIAAIHKYRPHPAGHFMEFSLDKACRNVVLKDAKGIWHTESDPEGRKGYTRVWLLCELKVSSVLPTFIVDYTAKRAMPRASNWLRPTIDMLKKEFRIPE